MHLLAFAKAGLSSLQDQYVTFDDERDTILARLNRKVITEREKAYSKCKEKVVAQLKTEIEESNKDNISETKKNVNKENNEEKIHELVMERLSLEYVYAYRQESVYAGTPIYKKRYAWIVLLLSMLSIHGIYSTLVNSVVSLPTFFFTMMIMLFLVDLQTGILHFALDNPLSFQYPVLSQPCLEFQWHHIIPYDVGDRKVVDILGDLNVIMVIAYVNITACGLYFNDPIFDLLRSLQIGLTYFAIYCHRLAHSRAKSNDFLTKFCHSHHKVHHLPPHDKNYCLIGLADVLVAPMSKYFPLFLGEKLSYFLFVLIMLGLLFIHPIIAQIVSNFDTVIRSISI